MISIRTSPRLPLPRLSLQTTDTVPYSDLNYEQIESFVFQEINVVLQQSGKSLADYHLPNPTIDVSDFRDIHHIIAEERADNP